MHWCSSCRNRFWISEAFSTNSPFLWEFSLRNTTLQLLTMNWKLKSLERKSIQNEDDWKIDSVFIVDIKNVVCLVLLPQFPPTFSLQFPCKTPPHIFVFLLLYLYFYLYLWCTCICISSTLHNPPPLSASPPLARPLLPLPIYSPETLPSTI